ncbi:MAG: hypothetical protein Q4D62_15235 [Planctomycetia bacterium]|nr:hypothetical protein [Planctomycetia bacterium]
MKNSAPPSHPTKWSEESILQQPWDGEWEESGLKIRYKCYPQWINALDVSIEDFPPQYNGSSLSFLLSRNALLFSDKLKEKNMYSRFYAYYDDPESSRQGIFQFAPTATNEEEGFQMMKRNTLQHWCLGEIESGDYRAIVCIHQFQRVTENFVEYFPYFFYQKENRYYFSSQFPEDRKWIRFMTIIYDSLNQKNGRLKQTFCPPHPKYPSLPRWHCWCNKKRTKAVLAELIKWNEETVLLRKYEDGKLLKIKKLHLSIEDQALLLRLGDGQSEKKKD